jgi:RNA polymerase sigma-70 factor (ECF subfamily)
LDTSTGSDRELQGRIRAGDESAFDVVFRVHYPHLVRMAESVVRERAVAEEIAQEVMLELWRRRQTLDVNQSFRAYLIRATRNQALNHLRHERVVQRETAKSALEVPTSLPADSEMLGAELERAVNAALDGLSPECREAFEMSRTQGMKYAEIAAVLEVSVKTVEKRMGRALAELRDRLAQWIPEVEKS